MKSAGSLTLLISVLAFGWGAALAAKALQPEPVGGAFYAPIGDQHPSAATLTELGRALFSDPTLSASGRMACASCHDPAHAYGPPNSLAVQLGGADGKQAGLRAVPSLRYGQDLPPFSEHFYDNDGDDSADQGPTGGHAWDGRAASAHEQAELPLLSPFEMANTSPAAVVERLRHSPNAEKMRATFGEQVFDSKDSAWRGLLLALEVFQQSPADFYPYSSKYDQALRGKANLSPQETRGLALFNDASKGNCAQCHLSDIKRGAFPQFTDYGHIALALPRNVEIPANADPHYFDLGLCGPLRQDLKDHPEYCGLFKAPTLRNVATRRVFFHNGVFHTLGEAVRFYAERDVHPERYYPGGRFNDLPAAYRENVNTDVPFGGDARLSESEIADIVAFLGTLTDADTQPVH